MPNYGRMQSTELEIESTFTKQLEWTKAGRPPSRRLRIVLASSKTILRGGLLAKGITLSQTERGTPWRKIEEASVNRLLTELEEVYSQRGLSLRSLGRQYGVSPARLGAVFAQSVGCSFRNYLRHLRIRKALALLSEPARSISEVAYAVGYKSMSGFDRDFKSILHAPPTICRLRALDAFGAGKPENEILRIYFDCIGPQPDR
jgi:AraC-like DNA-binding protein